MTPKTAASELIDKFMELEDSDGFNIDGTLAKQCALIAIDGMIEAIPVLAIDSGANNNAISFYKEMKEHIENFD